uniref:Myb transcription factor n=1 Tax=Rhizophora mucronata TaxID=61149 RepID=A0A2P2QD64_RHIMU
MKPWKLMLENQLKNQKKQSWCQLNFHQLFPGRVNIQLFLGQVNLHLLFLDSFQLICQSRIHTCLNK